MRIGKRKRCVPRQRNPLGRGGRQRVRRHRRTRACRRPQGLQINILAQEFGIASNGCLKIRMLDRLDQAQMAFGQFQIPAPGQRPQHRDARLFHTSSGQSFVPGAGHPVQDHTGKGQVGIVHFEPQRCGRRRLRLTADIDDQHHGPAHLQCRLCTRTEPCLPACRDPVEKPHGPFADADICPICFGRDPTQKCGVHRPAVKVERRPSGCCEVKGRVDIVGPAFEGLHREPLVAQSPQKSKHNSGFASARRRGRDQQTGGISHRRGSSLPRDFQPSWGGICDHNQRHKGNFRRTVPPRSHGRQG
mmetsp:Transcript_29010/g.55700  ORF Transcript_29010/g.55700 Transcript_29010/m.55700 type:complete len:303 (+) Transcript_29010:1802-2710(+)